MSKLVIIGNGIAGITVARNVRKRSEMDITIISSETEHFFFPYGADVYLHGSYGIRTYQTI